MESAASSFWLGTSKLEDNINEVQHQKRISSSMQCSTMLQTNDTDNGKKEEFSEQSQNLLNKPKPKDIMILTGDFNAKIGANNTGYDEIKGKQGLGQINENGELFVVVCAKN